jgi:hypothetical protein
MDKTISLPNVEAIQKTGKSYKEAVQLLSDLNGVGWSVESVEYTLQCHRDAEEFAEGCRKQSPEDAQAEYEAEMKAEGAWLAMAEYDPQAQDEMYREDIMGGYYG